MQLFVKIRLEEPLTLPVAYNHLVHGAIYHLLADETGFSERLHDEGAMFGKRQYKLFCFSDLRGRCSVEKQRITFYEAIQFEIRSITPELILRLEYYMSQYGIRIGKYHFYPEIVQRKEFTIYHDSLRIEMLSPITLYTTDDNTKKTTYYSPFDQEFEKLLNDNFTRKYTAHYQEKPSTKIKLQFDGLSRRDKRVTKFKTTRICGWLGDYQLIGKAEYLDFLYHTGLGSKNSQGFGLFRIKGKS